MKKICDNNKQTNSEFIVSHFLFALCAVLILFNKSVYGRFWLFCQLFYQFSFLPPLVDPI